MPSATTWTRLSLAAALTAVLAGPARAQEASGPTTTLEDPRAAKFPDVERGFFVSVEGGWLHLTKTPTARPAQYTYAGQGGGSSDGMAIGLTAGIDIGSRLAVALYALSANERASPSYGAFDVRVVGLDLRYAFLGQKDRNGWERFLAFAHVRGGKLWSSPSGLFSTGDTMVQGGLGIEYYAQLRHFSVGLTLDGGFVLSAKAPALAVTPTVRYTF